MSHWALWAPNKFGDKFGESLGGRHPSFWKVPRLLQRFPTLPRKFFGDFPGSSLTVEFNSNPEVPRKFPEVPWKFPDFSGSQPLSMGSLTPSPDSPKLSLINEQWEWRSDNFTCLPRGLLSHLVFASCVPSCAFRLFLSDFSPSSLVLSTFVHICAVLFILR